jgi:serine/threonine protein kinase
MLNEVHHPFIVNLWGTFQDTNNLYMVMDFVAGGELFSLLRKSKVPHTINTPKFLTTHPYFKNSDSQTPSPNSTPPK